MWSTNFLSFCALFLLPVIYTKDIFELLIFDAKEHKGNISVSMSKGQLQEYINVLSRRFICDEHGQETIYCNQCIEVERLLHTVTEDDELLTDSFRQVSVIILYQLYHLPASCYQDHMHSYQYYITWMNNLHYWYNHDLYRTLQKVIEQVTMKYIPKHGDVKQDDKNKERKHGKDEDETDHNHEEDHDETEHSHEDDHDDPNDHTQEDNHNETDHNHEDDHPHEDNHDEHQDEKDHHHENHHDDSGILGDDKCFSVARVLSIISNASYDITVKDTMNINVTLSLLQEAAAWTVYFLYKGYKYEERCGLKQGNLPAKEEFLNGLFIHFADKRTTLIQREGYERMLRILSIGQSSGNLSEHRKHDDGLVDKHKSHDGHGHKHKKRDLSHEHSHRIIHKCFSGDDLLEIFALNVTPGINQKGFLELCPALLQQKLDGGCSASNVQHHKQSPPPSAVQVYGYGTLSVAVISLAALVGGALLPCLHGRLLQAIMMLFISMAIGTLIGDSMLHLLPMGLGIHGHDHHANHMHNDNIILEPYVIKSLAFIAAIYCLFLLEFAMALWNDSGQTAENEQNQTESFMRRGSYRQTPTKKSTPKETTPETPVPDTLTSFSLKHKKHSCLGLTSLAWIIILGDAIHNLADGLAIGAAFSEDLRGGLSTSVAVLVHELPHELGDLAVLLASGLTLKKALLLNFLSALTAFIGFYVGASISTEQQVRQWIFMVTAGLFIYIALVHLMSDVIRIHAWSRVAQFCLLNLGFVVGIGLMFVIAVFEHKFELKVQAPGIQPI